MKNAQYFAGADGGGTKTVAEVKLLATGALLRGTFGPLNLNGSSEAAVAATMKDLIVFLAGQPGGLAGCGGLCIGAAGVSNPRQREALQALAAANGYQGPLLLAGDHETALAGALEGAPGMLLVAGTGSICTGVNATGEAARAGGWGHLIGDGGSGYAIGRGVLAAVASAEDGCAPPTALTPLLHEKLGVHGREGIVAWLYAPERSKKEVAALSPLLEQGLAAEDAAAKAILAQAADDLAALVYSVGRRLGLQSGRLALAGSVLVNSAPVAAALRQRLQKELPNLAVQHPAQDAATGALLLAEKRYKEEA